MGILKKKKRLLMKKLCSHGAMASVIMLLAAKPVLAAAGTTVDLTGVTTFITGIQTAVTGPIGKAAAIIALAATGFAFFTGRINWMHLLAVLAGILLIFGGTAIVGTLGAGGGGAPAGG